MCWLFLALVLSAKPTLAEEVLSKAELTKLILETVRTHPQVVIDILRSHSEAVLDIAQEGSNKRRLGNLRKQWQKDLTEKKSMRTSGRPLLGAEHAPVRIVAFSDFTCHYCQASKPVLDSILAEFKDKVSLVFKSIPLDEDGPSAVAALWFLAIAEQNQDKAWEFYNTMFSKRSQLQAEGEKYVRSVAKKLNLNMSRLENDVRNNKKLKTLLREDREDADKLNVEGTPCFFVNNIVVRGALSHEFFRVAVKMALDDAAK